MRSSLDGWLASHCSLAQGAVTAALFLKRNDGLQHMAVWPPGQYLPPVLVRAATAALAQREAQLLPAHVWAEAGLPAADTEAGSECILAQPLDAAGVQVGAAVMSLPADWQPGPEVMAHLRDHAQSFGLLLKPPTNKSNRQAEAQAEMQTEMLQLAHAVFEQPTYAAAAAALTSALAARFACDRVSLGFRSAGVTHVEAVSDGSRVDTRQSVFVDIASAMDEALDEAASLSWPQPEGAPPRILAAHAGLGQRHGLMAVHTVPIVCAGRVVGALTLEQATGAAIDSATLTQLENLALTVGPWLSLQRDAAMPPGRRLRRAVHRASRSLIRPGHLMAKFTSLVGLAVCVGLLSLPTRWEVRAEARLEGRTQRALAAPGDGYIRQVFVRPGDTVKAGQTLLAFDGEDLRLELQRLSAELAGEDAALGDALQRADRARLAIASARVQELGAQRDLIEQKLARVELKAPFDGVVIAGDLAQQLGAPVQRGAPLLTLAPAEGFRAIVEVVDADIAPVRLGQSGSLVLTAHPDVAWPMEVSRITPLASSNNGRQVFEVEVALRPADTRSLLPGMRGVARLQVGERPLALQWSHDVLGWLRLAVWRWLA